ncbi:hypothetical protein [Bradyrhizobium erythrophlei]|uniref:Uncharacterized protein n=1 Tax=Bradyrhizobium erythrophlei TaxID=1437360 RepID=A0A1M5T7A5_9BRAD|nr:hypothetical protein [Bradyrhizobium erythrophlei]SHH46635.1 hypothetical protein SAMN05444169_7597 [Bradyrhizobium erythrophlei]
MTYAMPDYATDEQAQGAVDLTPPAAPDPGLVDLTAKSIPSVSAPVALDRATKADYGWPAGGSPGVPQIQSALMNGDEASVRQRQYADATAEYKKNKIDLVGEANQKMWQEDPKATNDFLTGLIKAEPEYQPDTVFEHKYASAYIDQVIRKGMGSEPTATFNVGLDGHFNATMDTASVGERITTQNQIVQTKAADVDAKVEKMGMGSYLGNMAKTLLPGYQTYMMYNKEVEGISGSNRAATIQNLYTLPPNEMAKEVDRLLAGMESDPLQQQQFIHAVQHYGSDAKFLDNAFGALDVLTVGQAASATGKFAWKATTALTRAVEMSTPRKVVQSAFDAARVDPITTGRQTANPVQQAVKDAVQVVSKTTKPEDVLAANGHVNESADIQAIKILQGDTGAANVHELASQVPSLFNIDTITQNAGSLARSQAEDLAGRLRDARTTFVNVVADHPMVTRAPDEAYAVGVKEARDELTRRYPDLDRLVLDVQTADGELLPYKFNAPEYSRAGVGSVSVRLGDVDKNLFSDPRQAANHAVNVYGLDEKDPGLRIRPQGDKWFIELSKNLDETTDGFRNALINTKNTTPLSWANTILGKFRTPEDTLSELNRENRHALTHGTERIKAAFQQIAEESFKDLSKKESNSLSRVLKANQLYEDSTGKQGQFYKNVGEFENAFYQLTNERATPAQTRAYFGYVQLSDMDYVVRNLGWYRDKARLGVENFSFAHNIVNEEGAVKLTNVKPFEGKTIKDIPWDHSADAGIYVVDEQGNGSILRKNGMGDTGRADIQEKIKQGYRVIHVYAPEAKALGLDESVHFVVTKDAAATQLSWKQAPYQAGGHRVYTEGFHTKQPVIKEIQGADGVTRNNYSGDVAAFSHSTEAQAVEKSAAMDRARLALGKTDAELNNVLLEGKLPYSATRFRSLFEDSIVNGKTVPAYFAKDHPFLPTKSGQSTADRAAYGPNPFATRYSNFEDVTASPYNLSASVDKKFAGTRDAVLPKIERRGTEDNPVFQLGKSPLLDPMATLNQSLGGIIRNRMMSDHKTFAVESWAQEFGKYVDVPLAELKANPFNYIHDPVYRKDAPIASVQAARNALMNLKNLLGTEGDTSTMIRNAESSVMDFIYKHAGQEGVERVQNIPNHRFFPDWMLGAIKDPAAFMRSAAFHSTIGMFNPVQLALQAQTMVHSIAIGGVKNGSAGMIAGNMMRILGKNGSEAVLDRMASISESMSKFVPHMLNKADFIESYNAFKKSGLHLVEGEVGSLDRQLEPNMFNSSVGSFLHKGTIFFQEGERLVRYTAWNTAYKEWKAGNVGRELNNEARNEILARSNTFGANMTRASSSTWQQGVFSVPSQFWGYPMRLAEQMLGKRLTVGEKAHALATYGLMYGVPSSLSLATAVPFYDDMKTYALDKGYDVNSNYFKTLMEGIPSTMTSIATEAWTGKALDTDFASRMGVNGVSTIHDALHGNLSVLQFFTGASHSILSGIASGASPLLRSLADTVSSQPGEHPLKLGDFAEAIEGVKTLSYAAKVLGALSAGIYVSKNNLDVTNVSPTEAALLGAGLTPRRIKDANLMNQSSKEFKAAQKEYETLYDKESRYAIDAAARGDTEEAKDRMKRAHAYFVLGQFQETESARMLKKAIGNGRDAVETAHQNFLKNAPASELEARTNQEYPDMKN